MRTFFDRHTYACILTTLLVFWLPWLALLYPGVVAPNDTLDQLQQFFGMRSFTSEMAGQINPEVFVNNHHPALHTFILGLFVSAGKMLGSATIGCFAFVLTQMIALAASVAYALSMIEKRGTRTGIVIAILALFCIVPMFPIVACCMTKDVLFTACVIMLFCLIARLADGEPSLRLNILIALFALLTCLLRSIGIIVCGVLVVACAIASIARKDSRLVAGAAAGILAAALVIFAVYPAVGITPGSKGEMLSVPYQSTALIVQEHRSELSAEELDSIDAILDMDSFAIYDRYNVDPIKYASNFRATDDEKATFLNTWISLAMRYPGNVVRAWWGLIASYFNPLDPAAQHPALFLLSTGYIVGTGEVVDDAAKFEDAGIPIEQGGLMTDQRIWLTRALEKAMDTPLDIVFNMALYVWLGIVCCIAACIKNRRLVLPAVILLMLIVSLALSPAGWQPRYAYPVLFLAPIMLAFTLSRRQAPSSAPE